ncbi:MAG: LPS assembly protein LptD [Deltaproteobacteria bacterium]|jgi:LPS-assembly protein|nr:LPS assembly protein LptD [Deltaproteobacteria bacterium]
MPRFSPESPSPRTAPGPFARARARLGVRGWGAALLAAFVALALGASGALAQDWGEAASPSRARMVMEDSNPPIVVEADWVGYSESGETLEFKGGVVITRGDEYVFGDRALWHEPTRSAEIAGNVRVVTRDFTATAQRATMNMDLMLAKIYDGRAFFPARHYYVAGSLLERRGPETLYVSHGVFTTCDGPEPSWSLTAEKLVVNRDGVAESTGVTVRNAYFPMLYLPYLLVPVKTERQSGFLLPQFASSTRDGVMLALPFFWALKEDYDLTILPIYRSSRGLALTLEARYNLELGEGIWIGTFLRDRKDNFYELKSEGFASRNTREHFWLRAQNNWEVAGWDLNLDLDVVSDPLFIYAFRNDPDGFFYSRDLFGRYFGRTLNEELDPTRLSTFFAQRSSEDAYFRGTLSYARNLYRAGNVDTLQNIPSLFYSVVSRPLALGLFGAEAAAPRWSLDLRYDYYDRRTDGASFVDETGHRLIVAPSLFWQTDLAGAFSLRTSAALDFTLYNPDGHRPTAQGREPHDSFEEGLVGEAEVELSTTLGKVYYHDDGTATQHLFTPVVSFTFRNGPDQDRLPFFDRLDRQLNQRTLRYGFWNTFTLRSPARIGPEETEGYEYLQLLRLGVFHSYEFASNLKWADRSYARYFTSGYFDKGSGPLEIEAEANFNPYVTARILSSLDGRSGAFTSHDFSLNLKDGRGDSLNLIYDFEKPRRERGPITQDAVNQARGQLNVNFGGGWSTMMAARYDMEEKRSLETLISLRYNTQCYGLSLVWEDSHDDRRVAFLVNLLGLGSFGNSSSTSGNIY